MTERRRGPGVLFHIAAAATALFVLTVLVMIATVFADPAGPVNKWLNQYGTSLLLAEVAAIATTGCAAMMRDRQATRPDDAPSDDIQNV